jgi:mono/diheme cytochrome c family protein
VTGQIPANARVTRDPLDIWTNTIFVLDLRPGATFGSAEGWIDFTHAAAPDPDGIVALGKERVAFTVSGSDEVLLARTPGPHLRSYDPRIERRVLVGAHPRGIALTPDGAELWVANEIGNSLSVLDARTLEPRRTIDLGEPARVDDHLRARYLFGNARLTHGRQFTCNSCHPEGGSDGLGWQFIHVPDGLRTRNSRDLRGGVADTAPFRWTGVDRTLDDFIQEEVTGLLGGPRQEAETVRALGAMLQQLPHPPNPFRRRDGSHTEAAARGKVLFEGKAGCGSCHAGSRAGGTGTRAWVGTTPPGFDLDVPHLTGVHDSSPYLHDGRAKTLEEIFSRHNREGKHGQAHRLTESELSDLLRYVREL